MNGKHAARMKRRLTTSLLLSLATFSAQATHFSGGEIYYNCLGNDQYQVTLIIYRDCAGIQLDPQFNVSFESPCDNFTVQVNTPAGVEQSQLCDLVLPNSSCNGGTLPGIQQYTYTTTVTLTPCDSWTISWSLSNRNLSIANLQTPNQVQMYIAATLNNTVDPCDDSPQFSNIASPFVCLNYPVTYSLGAYDTDNDSLTYTLVNAMGAGASLLNYVAPYSATNAIAGLAIDPQSGLLSFTPTQAGNWVVVVQVNSYDSLGNLLGTVMRDMQFVAYPCSNVPPNASSGTISNVQGVALSIAPNEISVCENGTACFDLVITDANANNVLDAVTNLTSVLPGATFSFTGTNPITCTVCFTGTNGSAGTYPFTVNVNDGACPIPGIQTYAYTIHVIDGVFITVLASDASCAGVNNGTASVTVLDGTAPFQYDWSSLPFNTPTITAGAGSYAVQVTDLNGCVSAPALAVISTNQPPTAAAGPDQVACQGTYPLTLIGTPGNAASSGWSGGAGGLTGSGATAQYTPSAGEIAAGGVDLTFTAVSGTQCPNATDVVHIDLSNSFLNSSAASTNASCSGDSTGTATYSPVLAGVTYQWNTAPVQTLPTATGLGAGTYTVTATDALGCTTTLSTVITQPAALLIGNVQVIDESCAGQGNGSISITVSGGTSPYAYSWSNGANTSSITAAAGTYTVNVTDANGCAPVSATAVINAAGQPNIANAGPDLLACQGAYPIGLQATVVNATGGLWSGAGQFFGGGLNVQYTPTSNELAAGSATVLFTTAGNTTCPPDTEAVTILLPNSFQGATITTGPSCAGVSTGTAMYTPAIPGLNYLWNTVPAQTTPLINGLAAGTYSLLVTDTYGCDTTMLATVTAPPALVASNISSVPPSCFGGSNGSATVNVSGGSPGYTYQWSANAGSQNTPTANNLGNGTFIVVVVDAAGCIAQGTVSLTSPPALTLSAQVPDTACINAPVVLTAQAGGGTAPYQIQWTGIGFGSPITYSFPASQTVQVTVTDAAGCQGPTLNAPITALNLSTATLAPYGSGVYCPGSTASIGAAVNNYPGTVTFTWTELGVTGPGPFNVAVTGNQTYTVIASNGCGQTLTSTVIITLEVPPTITLPPVIAEGCAPLTVTMPDSLTTEPVTYLWDFGDGSTGGGAGAIHTYTVDGTFIVSLTVATPNGCTASAANTGIVIVHPLPTAEFSASPWSTTFDAPSIQFTATTGAGITAYDWTFGDGGTGAGTTPSYTYTDIGTFPVVLTVTDVDGCTGEVTHDIEILPVYDIDIPNAFSPNPNGGGGGAYDPTDLGNDVFFPFVKFVKDFKMRIYNRWGELVFESLDINTGWDGYYRGQLSQQDVYIYQLWIRFVDDKEIEKKGDLTLFR
jgi:PKD repeat protein